MATCKLPAFVVLALACLLAGVQAQSSCNANAPSKDNGCELPTAVNLVKTVVKAVNSADNPSKVYAAINQKDPSYNFNGFYPFVYDTLTRRVCHTNISSIGKESNAAHNEVGIPVTQNFYQTFQALAAVGGGYIQYIVSSGTAIFLKKAYIGPTLKDGNVVGSGYNEIAPCTYAAYTGCSPIAAFTLSDNFARLLEFAPNAQPLLDAVNKQVFPGTIPGGFYVHVYNADPASGYVCLAHGAAFAKAGKTPQEAETPDVAAALVSAFKAGGDQWINYVLGGQFKEAYVQAVESVTTGRKYFIISGYLTL